MIKILIGSVLLLLMAGCSDDATDTTGKNLDKTENITQAKAVTAKEAPRTIERWYKKEQVVIGQTVFSQNCAICHGDKAQGVIHPWNRKLESGLYPPPPLNGIAHAWHHPLKGLLYTIQNGGKAIGGQMPGFKDKLTLEEQASAIAYFQDFWSDKIYQAWLNRGGLK